MTTAKWMLLRAYNITLGRFGIFSRILRKILLSMLVCGKKEKYVASSRYFDWNDIKKE
jgi:hypothetical protein